MIFDPLEFMENKYTCKFIAAAAVVSAAAGAVSIGQSLAGGGGSSGSSGGGGGSSMPAYNPSTPTIQSQTPATLQKSDVAKTYNPMTSMQQWSSIFDNMPTTKSTTDMPDVKVPDAPAQPTDDSQSSGAPV